MMKAALFSGCAAVMLLASAAGAETPGAPAAVGEVTLVRGDVQVGAEGQWRAAAAGTPILETDEIRTGPDSGAALLFKEDLRTSVDENTVVKVADLLLKAQLEKMKARISAPAAEEKEALRVTPTTGVRGTEKTEEKAEDLKREHYWNDKVKTAE